MSTTDSHIRVPREDIQWFRYFVDFDEETLKHLVKDLHNLPPTLNIPELAETLASKYDYDNEEIINLIKSLWNWAIVTRQIGISADEFIDGVISYLDGLNEEQVWDDNKTRLLKERKGILVEILASSNAISLGAKAIELLFEQNIIFRNSKVITDLRPVFDEDADDIYGLLPFHILVINCFKEGKHEKICFSLDGNDIKQLHKQLERAMRKERLIKDKLPKSELNLIDTCIFPDIPFMEK